jgi:hypothetical protein
MAIPSQIQFDRFAQVTAGLEAVTAGNELVVNGVALVTGWLSGAAWALCYADPSTSWAACSSDPVTTWEIVE